MRLTTDRETLLKPLQAVQGVVERRQTLPILANVLLQVSDGSLSVTATDMELELVARTDLPDAEAGEVTVPARKLIDICRALPPEARIDLTVDDERAVLKSGRSRFRLATLPAGDYPSFDPPVVEVELEFDQGGLKRLFELTHFAMGQQDVRYYLNGLLLEFGQERLRAVATDGHRLAIADLSIEGGGLEEGRSIIVPRKGITELMRLLGSGEDRVRLSVSPRTRCSCRCRSCGSRVSSSRASSRITSG
jgi:DNA polymerase-3 subunit beta